MDRADLRWHRRPSSNDAALRVHLAELHPSTVVLTGRLCPACGSDAHGRPWARPADGTSRHVSLSRCGEHVLTAIAPHPVGVDVESVAAVAASWDPALVLHPGEGAVTPAERAAAWCGKEAVLKALGTGLRTPMSRVRLADWDVVDLDAPAGLAAAVVVLGPRAQAGSGGSSTA